HLGDKPISPWTGFAANPDSSQYPYPDPHPTWSTTQEERGQKYNQFINTFFNATSGGAKPFIGIRWWAYTDSAAERVNWGLVSLLDNAYDGKEAIIAAGTDPWGYQTGGEDKDYGDFLSAVKQTNEAIYSSLLAEFSTGPPVNDTTPPTATAVCSPSIVTTGDPFPCTCSGTDNIAVASTSESSTSGSTSDTLLIGTFTYTCTVTDTSGNSASATDIYTVSPAPQCILTNAYWSTDSTIEGKMVNLTVEGNNCDDEFVNFKVFEQDILNPDDATKIIPSDGLFISGKAMSLWTAEWQCDGNIVGVCTAGNPEYYFNAILNSDNSINIQSNLLDVLPSSPIPSNVTLDIYGGCTNCGVTGAVTGFFHTEKIGNRWWFIDPLGNPFWMRSVQNIDDNNYPGPPKYVNKAE
ncbi:hypothetical protein LCGC14_2809110, partial [marine sediment metagenome]